MSKIIFRIITNIKHMLNSHYGCKYIGACYQNPKVCFDLDFIAKNKEVLENGMKFELRNSIKGVSVI